MKILFALCGVVVRVELGDLGSNPSSVMNTHLVTMGPDFL